MAIERENIGFSAYCDKCSEWEELEEANHFVGAVELLKEKGWKITKENDKWLHICSSCNEE